MALRHIGYDTDLLKIETDKVSLQIRGRVGHPKCDFTTKTDEEHNIVLVGQGYKHVWALVTQPDGGHIWSEVEGRVEGQQELYNVGPLLYEETSYLFHVELKEPKDKAQGHLPNLKVHHKNDELRESLRPWNEQECHELTGVVNFRSNVGKSNFEVLLDDLPHLSVTLEVFPSKLDYETDYNNLLSEVQTITYNLIFDFLKKTYRSYASGDNTHKSPTEFFAILEHIFKEYLQALDCVLQQPYHQLVKEYQVQPSHKIKASDRQTLKWLQKHPQYVKRSEGHYKVERALAVKKRVSYDNKENRFVKYILQSTLKLINAFAKTYRCKVQDKEQNTYVTETLTRYTQELQKRLHNSLLMNLEPEESTSNMSLVFAMAPGYRELLKDYLLLLHGLNVNLGLFDIALKDLWLLYEYWCFIKLNYILRYEFGCELEENKFIRVDGKGIYVNMVKGTGKEKSTVTYKLGENTITLTYNDARAEEEAAIAEKDETSVTTVQKPDNLFTLTKKDKDGMEYQYIFDAKYRIYNKNTKFGPGPEPDTINTMHRYKDAIIKPLPDGRYARRVFGAYVLFPLHNEKLYQQHPFFTSIDKVNVGGLPFLPDKPMSKEEQQELIQEITTSAPRWGTEAMTCEANPQQQRMVREFLWKLINEKPEEAYARALNPIAFQ